MPAGYPILANSHNIRQVSDESASESSSESDRSEAPSDHSHSDPFDSQGSRKRRKISPAEDASRIHVIAVPSRIKPRIHQDAGGNQFSRGAITVPTDDQATFASLSVKPWLVNSLASMAIKRPTGIQKGCIPEILKGRDCIGGSRTGSGKTVAFAVPILQKWAEDPFGIFALVLTPTRYGSCRAIF